MTQETVAARLGVSRQPVSHALQVLRRRGLLVETRSMAAVLADDDIRLRSRPWAEHAEILTAILAGRPAAAERGSQQHAHRAGEYMTRRVQHLASVA
jgi:DNA-binding GntR family transcriptional regulator